MSDSIGVPAPLLKHFLKSVLEGELDCHLRLINDQVREDECHGTFPTAKIYHITDSVLLLAVFCDNKAGRNPGFIKIISVPLRNTETRRSSCYSCLYFYFYLLNGTSIPPL